MKNQYSKTITACFTAYVVQAVINNFIPLLFLTFQKTYHIPLSQITLLVTFEFRNPASGRSAGSGIRRQSRLPFFHDNRPSSGSRRTSAAHPAPGTAALRLRRNPDLCHGLCHWRRAARSAGKPDSRSLSFRSQGKSHEYAPFLLLLGSCGSRSSLHSFFLLFRNRTLEDPGSSLGSAPALQQPCLCPGSYRFSYRRRPAENELEGTLLPASVLDSADYDALCRRQ